MIKHKDFFFEDTIIDFYRNSNEVNSFCNLFKEKILPLTNNLQYVDKWLDVGIGDGAKILKILSDINISNKPELYFLEPSNSWINQLNISGNLEKIRREIKVNGLNRKFEDYIKNRNDFDFDFVSFIQVLYEPTLFDSLLYFIDNSINRKDYYLLINLENENNDLYKIRQILNDNRIDTPISQIINVEKELNKRKVEFIKFNTTDKKLNLEIKDIVTKTNINRNLIKKMSLSKFKSYNFTFNICRTLTRNKEHWFYPFLLGCNYSDFSTTYSRNEINKIYHIVENYLADKSEIEINDSTILATVKKGSI
ncbi:hypothetical protein HXX01_00250 [Candidatus Nomurabacteria bacterium]|nr:hypothetical protein [Candidatus Nomurabacteria bacterium]